MLSSSSSSRSPLQPQAGLIDEGCRLLYILHRAVLALGGLCRGTEPGTAPPWRDFKDAAPHRCTWLDIVDKGV